MLKIYNTFSNEVFALFIYATTNVCTAMKGDGKI